VLQFYEGSPKVVAKRDAPIFFGGERGVYGLKREKVESCGSIVWTLGFDLKKKHNLMSYKGDGNLFLRKEERGRKKNRCGKEEGG